MLNNITTIGAAIIILMYFIEDSDTLRNLGIVAWVIVMYFLGIYK